MPPLHKEDTYSLNKRLGKGEGDKPSPLEVAMDSNSSNHHVDDAIPESILHDSRSDTTHASTAPAKRPHNNNSVRFASSTIRDSSRASPPSRRRRWLCQWSETTTSSWHMAKLWMFGMMAPIGIVMWFLTQSIPAVIASLFLLPVIAILQGSLAILRYRVQFGDCPLPKAPSHGIVKCVSREVLKYCDGHSTNPPTSPQQSYATGLHSRSGSLLGESVMSFQGFVDPQHHLHPSVPAPLSSPSDHSTTASSPLRLLVIGDSLAIGVGQSKSSMPVMPETIAKSLSKAMNGRPVLWTCHGAPGASAGWIVRELERSIQQGQFLQAHPPYGRRMFPKKMPHGTLNDNPPTPERHVSFAEVDSFSSSDGSSSSAEEEANHPDSIRIEQNEDENVEELKLWSDRLKSHRIRFDPNTLGPFDIAVVFTGSNDLKSAFFPFLLKGEDAEFRRQAQERGGGYGNELARVLQVLNQRMRNRLQTMRQSVEAATEKVKESVDNFRERLGSHDLNATSSTQHDIESVPTQRLPSRRESDSSKQHDDEEHHQETTRLLQADSMLETSTRTRSSLVHDSPQFPMVVLPGMPARALPIFQSAPLRWLAVPIVDIMDSHKRKLARQHDREVLFVEAPYCEAIAAFSSQRGEHYEDDMDDHVLLNLRGIKKKQARSIESDMESYYSSKPQPPRPEKLPLRQRHESMFSVDSIHPNDEGYRFWGRYIANAIVEEWRQRQAEMVGGFDLV